MRTYTDANRTGRRVSGSTLNFSGSLGNFYAFYVGEHPQQPAGRYGKDGGKRDSADTSALASAVASFESRMGNL